MQEAAKGAERGGLQINGLSGASSPRIFRRFGIRSATMGKDNEGVKSVQKHEHSTTTENQEASAEDMLDSNTSPILSDKRKALFEPLEPVANINGKRPSAEFLLPPPDFESASYPRGWLIGKKRKLVNVDVVESMRRIAIQEMNRKDREIDGLNEQLEEDARCLEHLQLQLLEERSKRGDVERQNAMLQSQVTVLMEILHGDEGVEDEGNGQGL